MATKLSDEYQRRLREESLDRAIKVSGGVGASKSITSLAEVFYSYVVGADADEDSNYQQVAVNLQNMVTTLQEEKVKDGKRIDALTEASFQDYDRITSLRNEVTVLRARLTEKENS